MNTRKVKICGITTREDLQMVSAFQPDFLGIVCYEYSPRNVPLEKLAQVFRKGSRNVKKMMVSVNPSLEFLEERASFFHGFQLSGEETSAFCKKIKQAFPNHILWKAFRLEKIDDMHHIKEYSMCDAILLDSFSAKAYGGTGKKLSKEILQAARSFVGPHQDLWIAGGVSAENVDTVFKFSGCDGIDISSSLESSAGVKDKKKVEEFFRVV